MKDSDVAYLAGVVDSIGMFRVDVKENEEVATGFTLRPKFRLTRRGSHEVVFGMLDEFCIEQNVNNKFRDRSGTGEFLLSTPDDLHNFFETLSEHIIQQHEQLNLFMREIVPAIEDGQHHTKEGFVEVMELVDQLYELDPTITKRKYTSSYFKQKWSNELAK